MNKDTATVSYIEITDEKTSGKKKLVKGPIIAPELTETDYGNALRFAFYFIKVAFFHHAEKSWFCWDGKRWARDINNTVTGLIIKAVRRMITIEIPYLMYLIKNNVLKNDHNVPSDKWITKSSNRSKIRAAGLLAADLLPLKQELDSHRDLLNTPTGVVNLRTGELMPHDRSLYLTKITLVGYLPDALCPKWDRVLDRAFPNNSKGIRYIQKIFGYALTAYVIEKKIFILWGVAGNNGKTLFINLFNRILGADYCSTLASESLVSGRVNAIRSDLAKLKGFRFVAASETDKRYQFHEALLKLLTGGDRIAARHPHEKEIDFAPELTLILATNPKPEFTLSDEAMLNRVCIIPFEISIPADEQDKNLVDKLVDEEGPGILAWAVRGAVMWFAEGLGENPFDQKSAAVVHKKVTIQDFISECCDRQDKNAETLASVLMKAFNTFKIVKNDPSPDANDTDFCSMLDSAQIESKRSNKGSLRLGIKLNDHGLKVLEGKIGGDNANDDKGTPPAPTMTEG